MVVFYKEVCDKRDRDGVPQLDQEVHGYSIASWIEGGKIYLGNFKFYILEITTREFFILRISHLWNLTFGKNFTLGRLPLGKNDK